MSKHKSLYVLKLLSFVLIPFLIRLEINFDESKKKLESVSISSGDNVHASVYKLT